MKKKKIIKYLFILIFVSIIIFLLFKLIGNNGEKYISDNEYLYNRAINYLKEKEYEEINPVHDKEGYHFFLSYDGLGITEDKEYKYAYMWILGEGYYLEEDKPKNSNGYSMFYKFTFKDDMVVKYDIPKDGNEYTESIKKMSIDKEMYKKIINYDSKLSNKELVSKYYAKITDSKNILKEDIVGNNKLLFSISYKKIDCIPISLSVYDDGVYELYTHYEACRFGEVCDDILKYSKKDTGKYDYDVMKIINSSTIADNMTFTNEKLPEYEMYTGNGELVYMLVTDSKNESLNEFLKNIKVNLKVCATPDYKK